MEPLKAGIDTVLVAVSKIGGEIVVLRNQMKEMKQDLEQKLITLNGKVDAIEKDPENGLSMSHTV